MIRIAATKRLGPAVIRNGWLLAMQLDRLAEAGLETVYISIDAAEVEKHVADRGFFVSITARFRILYVFVAMEIGSRRILHFNITEHPTAEWTLQQLRETLPGDHSYRFLLHGRGVSRLNWMTRFKTWV